MYTGFAEVYDTLMNDVHYGAWADMYARMMTAYGIPRNAKVCECACGTGSLTLPLQQLGYEMMGIDLSQEMLWQAAQKARKAGFGIPFIRQDMRQLRLHRPGGAGLAAGGGGAGAGSGSGLSSLFFLPQAISDRAQARARINAKNFFMGVVPPFLSLFVCVYTPPGGGEGDGPALYPLRRSAAGFSSAFLIRGPRAAGR
mgnify:CR=1 FL=1